MRNLERIRLLDNILVVWLNIGISMGLNFFLLNSSQTILSKIWLLFYLLFFSSILLPQFFSLYSCSLTFRGCNDHFRLLILVFRSILKWACYPIFSIFLFRVFKYLPLLLLILLLMLLLISRKLDRTIAFFLWILLYRIHCFDSLIFSLFLTFPFFKLLIFGCWWSLTFLNYSFPYCFVYICYTSKFFNLTSKQFAIPSFGCWTRKRIL